MALMASSNTAMAALNHSSYKELKSKLKLKASNYYYYYYSLSNFKTATASSSNFGGLVVNKAVGNCKFLVRCSASDDDDNNNDAAAASSSSSSTTTTEEEAWEASDSESRPAEVPKGPSSLISALNVEKALRGIAITDADHYGRLGLRIGCSYDQVRVAYKDKIKELMSQGLDEEELNKKQELLKESYTILSSEEERRVYDWSLARSENPERYVWPFEVDITQTPKGTPPPQEPEDVGATRIVGYFLLGWLVLGFTLSIVLNL